MNATPPGSSRRTGGFSLLEILLVLVVIGILTSLAAPRMGGFFDKMKADSAVNQLANDVAYARMLAVRQGREVRFHFADATTYEIREIDPGGSAIVRRHGDLRGDDPALRISFDPAVTLPYELTFSPRGLLTPPGKTEIRAERGTVSTTLVITGLGRAYRAN